ncbi:MAG: hypothetical protein KGZ72_14685, partial [Roseovarius sp.]|nr:hypothetical protein [Roseovarius sp.]
MIEELAKNRHKAIEGRGISKIGGNVADKDVVAVHLDPVAGNHIQNGLIGGIGGGDSNSGRICACGDRVARCNGFVKFCLRRGVDCFSFGHCCLGRVNIGLGRCQRVIGS